MVFGQLFFNHKKKEDNMLKIVKITRASEMMSFQFLAMDNGIEHLKFSYMMQPKVEVYAYINAKQEICGGFILNLGRPNRTLDQNMLGSEVVRYIRKINKLQPAEITALWLKPAFRGGLSGMLFWFLVMVKLLRVKKNG